VLIAGREERTLDLLTFQNTLLVPLLSPRNGVGVAQVGATIFAFGGTRKGPLTVCEKCSVTLTDWLPLPHMHFARAHFTPTFFKVLLYLVSTRAQDCRAVESFSPYTETFTVLPVSLPADMELCWDSVTFVANGELTLLTAGRQVVSWKIEKEAGFRVSDTDRECFSLRPPLIVGTLVYIANECSQKVEKWSLEMERFI